MKTGFLNSYKYIILTVVFALITAKTVSAADLVKYAVSDVQALYVYEDESEIDWATIYYLNENFGCRVDLLKLIERTKFEISTTSIDKKQIYNHIVSLPNSDSTTINKLVKTLFKNRKPDIVIFDEQSTNNLYKAFKNRILSTKPSAGNLFNILKIYSHYDITKKIENKSLVILNSNELYNRYKDRIEYEVPSLFPNYRTSTKKYSHLTKFSLDKNYLSQKGSDNFLSGIPSFRLVPIIDSLLSDGPMKRTIVKQAKKYSSYLNASKISRGKRKVDFVVDGYRELLYLRQHKKAMAQYPEYEKYVNSLFKRGETAALDLVGIDWEGKIILRDSPHGPKLKFRVAVSVDGPREVTINNFKFHPYYDSAAVVLGDKPQKILPHQSFMKEFLIDIDRSYLEGKITDSLQFSVEIDYGQIPLLFTNSLPIWEAPNLKIQLEPDFYFVKPFPKVDVDKIVSNLNLKVIITKPYNYVGIAEINFKTPAGMFAGAYRKKIQLDKSSLTKTITIPFTISNLFELGTQFETVELLVNNQVIAADTGKIRIASCKISDTRTIGFLPDETGLLEDILNMTDAAYRPLTDRTLVKGDLYAYDVIIIGTNSFKNYPSFTYLKDRFEKYLRQGGSLVIMPQGEDWPSSAIPVSFVPTVEVVDKTDLTNRIKEARILSKPYAISDKNLLSSFYKKKVVRPAVIAPAERVFVTNSGATLLSVSRLGEGQIIYCGFPLLEMVSNLDIEAIHLFANILNY